jgi:hypothetical protein
MGIIADLQGELVSSEKPIGPILLKIRLLAAKLGSRGLEEWIKHEAEGYPQGHEVPDYRRLGMSFSGTFSGPFGSGVSNAPIAPALVAHFAGEENAKLALRESAASVDAMREGRNGIQLDCSNLILKLQGKVYPQFACNSVVGYVSDSALVEVSNAIRNRLLELTIG